MKYRNIVKQRRRRGETQKHRKVRWMRDEIQKHSKQKRRRGETQKHGKVNWMRDDEVHIFGNLGFRHKILRNLRKF